MENIEDELREISPLLRDLKRQGDGLRTPEGYFDDLDARVMARIDALGARRLAVIKGGQWFRRLLQPRMLTAIAAGLALIAVAIWFVKPQTISDQPAAIAQVNMPDLSEEDIETYVLENVHEFEPDQLAALPPVESADPGPETAPPNPAQHRSKRQQTLDNLQPEDLDNLLNELSDEELEQLL